MARNDPAPTVAMYVTVMSMLDWQAGRDGGSTVSHRSGYAGLLPCQPPLQWFEMVYVTSSGDLARSRKTNLDHEEQTSRYRNFVVHNIISPGQIGS
jgi:hypothetical protein